MRLRGRHPSIRVRLTLVYAVVLLATCAALLALNYALLYQSLYRNIKAPSQAEMDAVASASRDEVTDEKLKSYQVDQARIARLRADTLLNTAGTSAIALAVTATAGLGVSWIVAGRTLRPLRTLTAATRRISQDRLHERVALDGPHDELKELADTFDEMVTRLEASFNSQRRFVADAAHELRTPLAIVRTGAEVQLAKRQSTPEQWEAMARRALTATGRAERLLDGLLALARSDRGVIVEESHDLAVAAAAALSEADGEAEGAGLTITTDLHPAPVDGDPALLDRLVSNLVDNAVRHNHPGGWVDVVTGHADREAVITVRNSGDHIPPAEVDRLFEPFQRLASGRTAGTRSTGLGLAIVRSIVHAHGGTATAAPNAEGGLAVTIRLPARDTVAPPAEHADRAGPAEHAGRVSEQIPISPNRTIDSRR
jgi:signal transduction histidine kinase